MPRAVEDQQFVVGFDVWPVRFVRFFEQQTALNLPHGAWVERVLKQMIDDFDGFLRDCRYLIHDQDSLFCQSPNPTKKPNQKRNAAPKYGAAFKKWRERDLNSRPWGYESHALAS